MINKILKGPGIRKHTHTHTHDLLLLQGALISSMDTSWRLQYLGESFIDSL